MLGSYAKRRSTQRPSAVEEPPQSPQFGENDNVSSGGGASRQRSPSNNATPFDERVKSVRSRIREMVAVAGEDSSDASETYEANPMRKASVASRGSKTSTARSSAAKAASTAEQETGESRPTPKKRPKQSNGSLNATEGSGQPDANARGSRSSQATPPLSCGAGDAGQLVGRDGAAYVGARVRVLDPKVARYVEPTGVVVEVRCEGERVRVEHDGPEKAQRYYNTGKNAEFQIEFEKGSETGRSRRTPPAVADSSDEELAPAPAPRPKAKAAVKKGIPRAGGGSRSSKALAGPLDEEADDVESTAGAKRASRPPATGGGGSRSSKALAGPLDEEADDVESTAAAKRTSRPPATGGGRTSKALAGSPDEEGDDVEINALQKSSRYSQLREKRQSTCQDTGSLADANTASSSTAPSTSKASAASPRPASSPDPEGRAKIPYSQRRSMRFSQADVADVAAVVAKVADCGDVNAPPANGDSIDAVLPSRSKSPGAEKSSGSQPSKEASAGSLRDQSGLVDQLRKDHVDFAARLRNLEQSFVKDLGAVQDDVNRQMEITEKRIVARVLEELEKRLREATKTAFAEAVKPAKLSMDAISSQEPAPQGVGTPVNYEPEQEYAESDLSECQAASRGRRASDFQKNYVDEAVKKVTQQAAALESKEELADNRQRLEHIGNVARRITGSLSGPSTANEPTRPVAMRPEYNGSQTPDFAATFSGSPSQSLPAPDGLDAEMARLAEMRRFASNVMKAAEVQSQMLPNTATSAPAAWSDSAAQGWAGSSLPGPPPSDAQMYAGTHQMGPRDHDRQAPPPPSDAQLYAGTRQVGARVHDRQGPPPHPDAQMYPGSHQMGQRDPSSHHDRHGPSYHPEAQMYAGAHQMGPRDPASHRDRQGPPHFEGADRENFRMNPGGSGRRSMPAQMPAQMPGVPPWAESSPRDYAAWDAHGNAPAFSPRGVGMQAPPQAHQMQAEHTSKQQFFRPGKGARHSYAQPMRPSWPAAPSGPGGQEWDCTPTESEGRLVF